MSPGWTISLISPQFLTTNGLAMEPVIIIPMCIWGVGLPGGSHVIQFGQCLAAGTSRGRGLRITGQ